MSHSTLVGVALFSFAAGLACAGLASTVHAQGTLTELKRVDLGAWCEGKEAVISIEQIAPQLGPAVGAAVAALS